MARSFAYLSSTISSDEHFRQNRHAFEQEERQVHGAGDLVGGARLARDALGGRRRELADAEGGADDDQAEPERGAEIMQTSSHSSTPLFECLSQ